MPIYWFIYGVLVFISFLPFSLFSSLSLSLSLSLFFSFLLHYLFYSIFFSLSFSFSSFLFFFFLLFFRFFFLFFPPFSFFFSLECFGNFFVFIIFQSVVSLRSSMHLNIIACANHVIDFQKRTLIEWLNGYMIFLCVYIYIIIFMSCW